MAVSNLYLKLLVAKKEFDKASEYIQKHADTF
jgi:hypothetical protein